MINSVYLVVEPMIVIATDLAMNVQDYDPWATVLVAHSPEAACEVLRTEASVKLAFVNVDLRKFCSSDLARALNARGARIVFAGASTDRMDCDKLVLDWPFSTETTADLLQLAETMEAA